MDWYSWLRSSVSRRNNNNKKQTQKPNQQIQERNEEEEEEELLGVSQQLIDHVKSFTVDIFKNFPLLDDEAATSTTTSTNVLEDLSEWQERHATLVLSKAKELSQLRFTLCPRHMKERQFWRIYFMLVRSHVIEYELRAIQLAKLKRMAVENEISSNTSGFEVEMAETRHPPSPTP